MIDASAPGAQAAVLQRLQPSPRMPVLFVGHGSPMNVIEEGNAFRQSWEALGAEFGRTLPRPQVILCISAHWLTRGWWLTAVAEPRTIHDFGGFPQALFDQRYPAPGAPALAAEISRGFDDPPVGLDEAWGYDHGSWSVLKPMFPGADIPVLQLSMDYSRPPAEHFALGRQLRRLRDLGVLIVGSGNVVHNLRALRRDAAPNQAYDWCVEFDAHTAGLLAQGELARLADFQQLGEVARLAHPSHEHYLPLLYAAGAAEPGEDLRFFNEVFQAGAISMRSVVWGG